MYTVKQEGTDWVIYKNETTEAARLKNSTQEKAEQTARSLSALAKD